MSNTATLTSVNVADVVHVYSGRANTCACGCKGKHTYASSAAAAQAERRGYAINADEINDSVVRRHVNTINKVLSGAIDGTVDSNLTCNTDYVAVTIGDRWVIAYMH
jgi:hypothetical protein